MNNNGTDRDIALSMVGIMDNIQTLIETINTNISAPVIITQPVSIENVSLNDSVTFSVVAKNAVAYQWQLLIPGHAGWENSQASGSTNSTWTFSAGPANYADRKYRCKITGIDNSVIYSAKVTAKQICDTRTCTRSRADRSAIC